MEPPSPDVKENVMNRTFKVAVVGLLLASGIWAVCAFAQSPRREPVAPVLAPAENGHELTVNVTGLKDKEGDLLIMLFTKEDGFPQDFSKAALTAKVSPEKPSYKFEKLAAGKYVVMVLHDRNKNGKLDKPTLGPPSEPIGLSHHAKIGIGAMPNFDKAKVDVSKATTVEVKLLEFGK
jgi:uncharacterized protein (DUF2141 family)